MEYKGGSTSFVYNLTGLHEAEEEAEGKSFSCLLDIFVHEALNLHNICIYANQDVYAKFSLTSNPDEALSTSVVPSGGNSPRFNERLPPLRIPNPSDKAVLKVEIWMLSCAKTLLGDQLLGFTLIPVSSISSTKTNKSSQEFTLSSTDLFHSPAGTIRLNLTLNPQPSIDLPDAGPSITSEVVILNPVVDYRNIEFPDINAAQENQKMVMQYFDMAAPTQQSLPFIQLTPSVSSVDDCEMVNANSSPENRMQNPTNFTGSTITSFNNDKKIDVETFTNSSTEVCHVPASSPETPTSKEAKLLSKDKEATGVKKSSVFKLPLENICMVEEQGEMQKQIMNMYMKSMQQFTDSLEKMKLPMDIDKTQTDDTGILVQGERRDNTKLENKNNGENKKDGSRVFYGSRAFF